MTSRKFQRWWVGRENSNLCTGNPIVDVTCHIASRCGCARPFRAPADCIWRLIVMGLSGSRYSQCCMYNKRRTVKVKYLTAVVRYITGISGREVVFGHRDDSAREEKGRTGRGGRKRVHDHEDCKLLSTAVFYYWYCLQVHIDDDTNKLCYC